MLNEGNQIHNFYTVSTFVILLRFRSRKYGFWFRKTAVLVRNRIHIHQIKESFGIKQNIIGIWAWNQVFFMNNSDIREFCFFSVPFKKHISFLIYFFSSHRIQIIPRFLTRGYYSICMHTEQNSSWQN